MPKVMGISLSWTTRGTVVSQHKASTLVAMAYAAATAASGVAMTSPAAIARCSSSATLASATLAVPKSVCGLGKSFGARLASVNVAVVKVASVGGIKASSQKRGVVVPTAGSYEPLVGNVAPDFDAEAVFDQEFIKIKLSEYIGKKYVVLFFYPLDFTFVCPTEITAFSDRHSEFAELDTDIIGVSTDSVFSHLAWIQTDRKTGGLGDLNYPIVSDITKKISKAFNVLIPEQGIALRGLFIIDKQGVIQHATINNLGIGRSVDETLRTLQAVQYVQDNPDEVCPAGWKPGEKTMKPDSKLSKEYFEAI